MTSARPLIVSDCDEVLLHMVVPFRAWLDEAHDIHFALNGGFVDALRHKSTGDLVEREAIWPLLEEFFATQMHRQTPIAGAVEAMRDLGSRADVVILTNIGKEFEGERAAQLHALGIPFRVIGNRGEKGPPLQSLIDEFQPPLTIFIDDLGPQHKSVGQVNAEVWRLQLVGEPEMAPHVPTTRHAHARIDDWSDGLAWINAVLEKGEAAQ